MCNVNRKQSSLEDFFSFENYICAVPLLGGPTVGPILLKDVAAHSQQPPIITESIIASWLKGGGKEPVTWATFIKVPRQIDLLRNWLELLRNTFIHSPSPAVENGTHQHIFEL